MFLAIGSLAETTKTYSVYPKIVELKGFIITKKVHGTFDEDPKGPLYDIYILKLLNPINVKGNPKDLANSDDYDDVREIQLLTTKIKVSYKKFINKKVKARAFLYERSRGDDYTDVLMEIKSIRIIK